MPLSFRSVLGYGLPEAERLKHNEGRYVGLLITALLPVFLLPITSNQRHGGLVLLAVILSLLILQSLYTLARAVIGVKGRVARMLFVAVGLLCLVGVWIPALEGGWPTTTIKLTVLSLLSLFFLDSSVRIVQLLARAPRVSVRVMAGAAAGYVLLGITGGILATTTETFLPGSFHFDSVLDQELLLDRLTYFSFVTIGGLGPGDIVAGNAVGERFVILLSVCSTLYVALLVGLLLGRFIASQEVEYLVEDPIKAGIFADEDLGLEPPGSS